MDEQPKLEEGTRTKVTALPVSQPAKLVTIKIQLCDRAIIMKKSEVNLAVSQKSEVTQISLFGRRPAGEMVETENLFHLPVVKARACSVLPTCCLSVC